MDDVVSHGTTSGPSPLTPLPSDGRGEQQSCAALSLNRRPANPMRWLAEETENDSPSPIGWERAGVRALVGIFFTPHLPALCAKSSSARSSPPRWRRKVSAAR